MSTLFLTLLLAASSPSTKADQPVIDAVKAQLKDPDSAKFKGVKETSPGYWCGWVNAKNGYGGYVGFQVFYYHDGRAALVTPELSEPSLCQ